MLFGGSVECLVEIDRILIFVEFICVFNWLFCMRFLTGRLYIHLVYFFESRKLYCLLISGPSTYQRYDECV